MVTGLDKFKEFFADYRDCYVLIGGSACDYSKDIGKHKSDIARIAATVGVRDYGLPGVIKERLRSFMARYADADIDVSALGVPVTGDEIKRRLAICFGV